MKVALALERLNTFKDFAASQDICRVCISRSNAALGMNGFIYISVVIKYF